MIERTLTRSFARDNGPNDVPIADSALLSSKIVQGAMLKIYPGAPHGLCSTLKDQINTDLLAFLKA